MLLPKFLSEGNTEQPHNVTVRGPAVDVGLDDGPSLLDEAAHLVPGHVHAVEVGEAVVALDVLDAELDFTEGEFLVVLEVGEGYLDYAALEAVGGDLGTGGFGDNGFAKVLDFEHGWGLEFVPFFLEERVLSVFVRIFLVLVLVWRRKRKRKLSEDEESHQ